MTFFLGIDGYGQESVFFGSYNGDKNTEGILVYRLDTISGKLDKITAVKDVFNPSYLTISPNGKYVYACTDTRVPNSGSITAYEFDAAKKSLTFLNSQKSGGENPVYVNVHHNGKWLVNSNYNESTVSVYPILKNGVIDSLAQLIKYTEASNVTKRQEKSHVHSAVFSPDQNAIFFPDLGADKIWMYPFENTQKQPIQTAKQDFIKTNPGSGPRHFTFSKNQKFAYCIEELSGSISVYRYQNMKLQKIQDITTHSNQVTNGFESADIHISPDGKFLYASNRGTEDNIAIFRIESNGTLKVVGYEPTHGKHPRSFAISKTGKFVIVANVISGTVTVFKRDFKTGKLQKLEQTIAIKNVSCVKTTL